MADSRLKPNQKLATALKALMRLQDKHYGVVESRDMDESHRVLLLDSGFLRPVIKGWYICANPADQDGDSTAWYASYWAFLSGYLGKRFGKRYCLNPEASILLHTGSTVIPRQVVVVAKIGGNFILEMPHNTSAAIYENEAGVPKTRTDVRGLQVEALPDALCRVGPQFFRQHPREAEIALSLIRDPGELLSVLLSGSGSVAAAGRLAGGFRFLGRNDDADRILNTMRHAGYLVRETNPFEISIPTLSVSRERSPYVLRLRSMWFGWREQVLDVFPAMPGLPIDVSAYLGAIDERYKVDAYNSLSIEGYQVSDELIERVAKKGWKPDADERSRKDRDALAARGYYQAFQAVRKTIATILDGRSPGALLHREHHAWFSELFAPAVRAGILQAHQLAGYRNSPVYIRNSQHTPLPREALADAMETLFSLIGDEPEPAVRAVLGHQLFVFIHPYYDGNGRIGRFLMNALLASGGYPWTVIRMKRRNAYMAALEKASVEGDIKPFAKFVAEEMQAWEPR